jgi:ATP synthase protein I
MSLERELLGRAFVLSLVAGIGCVLVAVVVSDGATAAAAAVGSVLVVAFLAVGQVPIAAAARGHSAMAALLLLLGYVSRVMVLLVALLVVLRGDGLDRVPLGVSVMVTAAAWTVGAVWSMVRWQPVLIEPLPDTEPGHTEPGRTEPGHTETSDPAGDRADAG